MLNHSLPGNRLAILSIEQKGAGQDPTIAVGEFEPIGAPAKFGVTQHHLANIRLDIEKQLAPASALSFFAKSILMSKLGKWISKLAPSTCRSKLSLINSMCWGCV
jgi:hypothetical protein